MKTCENCGSRVYDKGCTWCNEEAYIAAQETLTDQAPEVSPVRRRSRVDKQQLSELGSRHD